MGIATVAVYSRVRPRRAARAHGRRGLAGRPERAARKLPAHRRAHRRRARGSGADAVHPGYGFLAENEDFARRLPRRRPDLHRADARSDRADGQQDRGAPGRHGAPACRSCPAPTTPLDANVPDAEVLRIAEDIGYPLMLKAVAGGGGKGMRTVAHADRPARRAARRALGSRHRRSATPRSTSSGASCTPRHIEVQLLGDHHGTVRAVRRTRVLDSAPPPEGHRGEPVAGRLTRAAPRASPAAAASVARRSATPTPARSSSCSTTTAASTSSR